MMMLMMNVNAYTIYTSV